MDLNIRIVYSLLYYIFISYNKRMKSIPVVDMDMDIDIDVDIG